MRFATLNGIQVDINDVNESNSFLCCVCCKKVIAAYKCTKVEKHFKHKDITDCTGVKPIVEKDVKEELIEKDTENTSIVNECSNGIIYKKEWNKNYDDSIQRTVYPEINAIVYNRLK